MQIIELPRALELPQVLAFLRRLRTVPVDTEYQFDFGRMEWSPAFGLLMISRAISGFVCERGEAATSISAVSHKRPELSYAAHMGFFQACGLPHGKSPGEAPGGMNYLPLRCMDLVELRGMGMFDPVAAHRSIETQSREIAQVLSRDETGPLQDTLAYSFREILRNALEHSRAREVWYCAQYWPTIGRVEIGIADTGRGVRSSLSTNRELKVESDRHALTLALLPGISGKPDYGVAAEGQTGWENSGFGLFMTSRLCGAGGSFFILSASEGLLLEKGRRTWRPGSFQGTAIRAVLRTDRLEPLTAALERINKDGVRIAKEQGIATVRSASHASRVLSREFRS